MGGFCHCFTHITATSKIDKQIMKSGTNQKKQKSSVGNTFLFFWWVMKTLSMVVTTI